MHPGWRTKRRWDVYTQCCPVYFDMGHLQWAKYDSSPSLIQDNWQLAGWIASVQLVNIDKAGLWLLIASNNSTVRSPCGTKMQSDCSAPTFCFRRCLDRKIHEDQRKKPRSSELAAVVIGVSSALFLVSLFQLHCEFSVSYSACLEHAFDADVLFSVLSSLASRERWDNYLFLLLFYYHVLTKIIS